MQNLSRSICRWFMAARCTSLILIERARYVPQIVSISTLAILHGSKRTTVSRVTATSTTWRRISRRRRILTSFWCITRWLLTMFQCSDAYFAEWLSSKNFWPSISSITVMMQKLQRSSAKILRPRNLERSCSKVQITTRRLSRSAIEIDQVGIPLWLCLNSFYRMKINNTS